MTLFENLQAIAHLVERNLPKMKNNEDATINVSVSPFIRALGYNTQDLDEVYPQYPILNTDAVDYAVLRDDTPVMFVEAKSAGNKLQNKEWKQLFQYFNAEIGLRFGILTNGVEYRFYTDLKADNIMDKEPFLTLDLLNLDERLVAELEGFTKTDFDPSRIKAAAKKQVILRLLQQEMDRPSDALVKHFASQVHSGRLLTSDLPRYASIVKQAWRELLASNTPSSGQINGKGEKGCESIDRDVVEIPVFRQYYERQFEGTLLLHRSSKFGDFDSMILSKVRFDDDVVSLTMAAKRAVKKVNPKVTGPNGWDWWKFMDSASGKEHVVNELLKDEALREQFFGNA